MARFKDLESFLRGTGSPGERKLGQSATIMLFLSSLAGLWPAFLNRVLFDRVVPDHCRQLVLPVFISALALEGAGAWCRYRAEIHLADLSRSGRFNQRWRQSSLLWRCSPHWFGQHGAGGVIRHYEDAGELGSLHSRFLKTVVGPGMTVLLLLPPMFMLCPLLAGSRLLLALPAFLIGSVYIGKDLKFERRIWSEGRILTSLLAQGARGIATLTAADRCDEFLKHLRGFFHRIGSMEYSHRVHSAGWEAWVSVVSRISATLSPTLAVLLIMSGRLTFGTFIAFSILAARCLAAIGELLNGLRTIRRAGNPAARRRALVRNGFSGDNLPGHSFHLAVFNRDRSGLQVRNLSYAQYPPGDAKDRKHRISPDLIRNASFEIRRGERVALHGASGMGKTTLFSLILGLLIPDSGSISWSGHLLNSYPRYLRSVIAAAVSQTPAFFEGSFRENLCLFSPPPGDYRIREALEMANASDIVSSFSRGLDARLPASGEGLSGGERQRLALARVFLSPAPLILLDEPFKALDSTSLSIISQGFCRAVEGKSVLLIHHGNDIPVPVQRGLRLEGGMIV